MLARHNDTNNLWTSSKLLPAPKRADVIADAIVTIPRALEITRLEPLFGTGAKSIVIPAVRGITDSTHPTTEEPSTPVPDKISPEHIASAVIKRDDTERAVRYDNIRIRSISEILLLVVFANGNVFSLAPNKSEDFVFSPSWPSRDPQSSPPWIKVGVTTNAVAK